MKRFLSWIGRIRFKYYEYVYLFSFPITGENDNLKQQISSFISTQNNIIDAESFTNFKNGETFFLLSTAKSNPFLMPLYYEIYAYTHNKDIKKVTYKYKTLIFKNTTILKFKIKCYGKR